MTKRTRSNETTKALSGIFALAVVAVLTIAGLLLVVALVVLAPLALLLLCGYGLVWLTWRTVIEGRTQQSAKAASDLADMVQADLEWVCDAVGINTETSETMNRILHYYGRPGDLLELFRSVPVVALECGTAVPVYYPLCADDYSYPESEGYTPEVLAGQTALPEIVSAPRIDAEDVLDMRPETPDMAIVLRIDGYPEWAFEVEEVPCVAVLPVNLLVAAADAETGDVLLGGRIVYDDEDADRASLEVLDATEPVPAPMPAAARVTTEAPMDLALRLVAEGHAVKAAAREAGVAESTLRGRLKRQKKEVAA